MSEHYMLPGTHEWPRSPECRCGGVWDWWNDRCLRAHALAAVGLAPEEER